MAEYIEREAALIICEKEYQERVKMQDWCGDTVAWNIGHAIKAIQTADVVPVVRCKDCKHWNKDALACDTLPWVNSSEHANWYADDFCSYGERKGGDGNG
jgi:hypothetical protein